LFDEQRGIRIPTLMGTIARGKIVKDYRVGYVGRHICSRETLRRVEFSGILAFDWKCDNTNEQAFLRWRIKVHAIPWVLEHLVFQFLEI